MFTTGIAAINLKNGSLNKALFLLIIPLQNKIIIMKNIVVPIIMTFNTYKNLIKDKDAACSQMGESKIYL